MCVCVCVCVERESALGSCWDAPWPPTSGTGRSAPTLLDVFRYVYTYLSVCVYVERAR